MISDAHLLIHAKRFKDGCFIPFEGRVSIENFRKVVDQILTEKPDVIIIAGDMFDQLEKSGDFVTDAEAAKYWPNIQDELRKLINGTKYGVYALKGNHDSSSILIELENSLGSNFHFVRNKEEKVGDFRIYFMESNYRRGYYEIPEEKIPSKGDILIMHETLPVLGIPGLKNEIIRELSKRFNFIFNGHMHSYDCGLFGSTNLYSLPALIPSHKLKCNYMIEYHWPGDLDVPKKKDSPFGYVILEGNKTRFKKYTPVQKIIHVNINGNNPNDVIEGINEVYSKLLENEIRPELLWVWVSAKGVTFKDTIRKETNKYQKIRTLDIFVERTDEPKKSIELKGIDKIMDINELENKVLNSLQINEKELAQDLFDEIFTNENLSKKVDVLRIALFEKSLQLSAQRSGIIEEHMNEFLSKIKQYWVLNKK